MSKKIDIAFSKTLRLNNVLGFEILPTEGDIEAAIRRMENYIKLKGAQPIGPLIQYSASHMNSEGNIVLKLMFFRQSSCFINPVESPYSMESILRITDCMYARFVGEESKIGFAFNKINLVAFEEDIALKGDSYTVYVDRADQGIVADVFMEKKHD